ncbi:PTS sugar transporter subunit IIA [Lacrimispora indolis]|mgnify:CR=1 FL=1|uniref:PTS sugar transporter subunit IIA n=1 Tax=Lacrimispora indolis TaxID=69825 RepID=UPI000411D14D|nr:MULTISPECIES: PTS sugar transporter subunit IIA [Lachnospiraceae]
MVNILTMTHGEMAQGLYQTVNMVIGEQENFSYLPFRPDQSLDSLIGTLKNKLEEFKNDLPCLVLVDLFGGSPSNAIVHLIAEGYNLQAVAGVNLPMVITALTEREMYSSVEEFTGYIRSAGSDGVVNIVERLMEE